MTVLGGGGGGRGESGVGAWGLQMKGLEPLSNYYLQYYKTDKEHQKVLHILMYKTPRYVNESTKPKVVYVSP